MFLAYPRVLPLPMLVWPPVCSGRSDRLIELVGLLLLLSLGMVKAAAFYETKTPVAA
ncbi:MAG: hypothetical protein ACTH2U_06660 [Brevibacterium sp.]